MTIRMSLLLLVLLICVGCAGNPVAPDPDSPAGTITDSNLQTASTGQFLNWGSYNLEIARDGSYANVTPDRYANAGWGCHLNAVKLLEVHPCTDCLKLGNIHLTPDGDVSVDISITHPWPALPEENLIATGFDVRGIIIFKGSQYFPDNQLRLEAGLDEWPFWIKRYSVYEKGDPELINAEGWTTIWAPDGKYYPGDFQLEEGLPIFEYYPGKFASGEDLGTLNAFRRFYSNENRHMFETGKTVTRTYIIRPPSQGDIEASYVIYAHWAPPTTVPVTDPAVDFPPEANSPMPYEFWVTQDAVIDPDVPNGENWPHIHWHIKTWDIAHENWSTSFVDLLYSVCMSGDVDPYPNGEPDDYYMTDFRIHGYKDIPDGLPGEWPYIFSIGVKDPDEQGYSPSLGTDWYIAKIAIDEVDGEW